MSKFQKWQKSKHAVPESISWLGNSEKIDSQDRGRYSLKVSIGRETFQYCGQAYAGANNYHSAPVEFIDAVQEAIKKNHKMLFDCALEILKSQEKANALLASDEVDKMQQEIAAARGTV